MATAHDKLRNSLNLNIIKHIFNTLDEGILVVDSNCKVLFYNQTLSKYEGLEPQNVVGKLLFDVFPSLTPEESTLYQVVMTGEPITGRFQRYINYNGRQLQTVNTTIPIIEEGEIVGALEVSRDMSVIIDLTDKVAELQQQKAARPKFPGSNGFRFSFADIIGSNRKIREIIEGLKKVARTSSSVLLYGETGTGKELFAQSIHYESPRKNHAFIAQNCAALPESLLESLLFGTTRGSFTGALDKPGLFEQAHGGTILLDEINSMGFFLQAKILRVLQEGLVRRLGGAEDIPVNVRIIATTNEKPSVLLKAGKLRKDLFYRLSVIYVEIPALRERIEDVEELARYFVAKYNSKFNKSITHIDDRLLKRLQDYRWPGNVRELEHVIEAMMNFADDGRLTMQYLDYLGCSAFKDYLESEYCVRNGIRDDIGLVEKNMIINMLDEYDGNISHAAKAMGLKRQALQYRLKKYNIFLKDQKA
ncbi:Arginine utilization regulatory protein RocR [Sporomusa rhizae]|uniref:sigma-54 interaction domain-containing protein n=1 Tax=Sporomusa rhizae TaxID=357999 RepID=UPI00352A8DBD